jgi:hypothetical protein
VSDDDDDRVEPPEPDPPQQPPEVPRKRFRTATTEELDPQSFIVSDNRSVLRAVLRGGSIGQDRGDAHFIGGAIRRLADALRESAQAHRAGTGSISNPLLRRVAWGSSVIVELEASPEEDIQLDLEQARHSPTIDAAKSLSRLMMAEPEELLPLALELPQDAVAAYKRFLNLLAADSVVLEWQVPDSQVIATVTSVDARHDWAILDREGERTTESVIVPGTLTMADSRRHRFELTLPAELDRPPLLKRKQTVEGTYAEDIGHRLKEEGLWDSEVMAEIEVTYDRPGSTPTPRDPVYVLVDAEPLLPSTPTMFG